MRRRVAVLTLVLSVLAVPVPAWAHASLVSMDPATGSTVAALPEAVTLRFSEPVTAPVTVVVTAPTGQRVSVGGAALLGDRVTERLREADSGQGAYTVGYQALSADGHVVNGTEVFTVSGSGATSADEAGTSPARPSVLLAALALVVLLMLAVSGVGRLSRGSDA